MDYYDNYLSTHHRHVTGLSKRDFEYERKAFARECAKLLPTDKNARILDVGCGTGHFLYFLDRSEYRNYLGIDISPEQVAFCRDRVTDKVEVADAFEFLASMPDHWDVVFSSNFVEHLTLDQLLDFVHLVYSSLRNEGIAVLRTTNLASPFKPGSFWDDLTHTTPFTEKSMAQLLAMGGFDRINVYPSACRLLPRLVLSMYKLVMLPFGARPPIIVTPAVLGVGRKTKSPGEIGLAEESAR
jgi:cyclopropane fatty-acyl-phospholipid synthase-like methyltransferase